MWYCKQIPCLIAFMVTEISAMTLFFVTIWSQASPMLPNYGPLTPQAMTILAYSSMVGVIIGGVIQVFQLFVNSKNSKLEASLALKEAQDKADKEARVTIDIYHAKEIELLKTQAEVLRQQAVWVQGWQTTILNQKPGEPYGDKPTFAPDPATSTPQAMEHARVLPLVSIPLTDTELPPVVPVPPEFLKTGSGSGIFLPIGTQNATTEEIKENTDAVRETTQAVKETTQAVRDVAKKI
jgi:hypothetical protein